MIRVLIATTTRSSARGCASCCPASPGSRSAGEAADGDTALDAIRALAPDVVLLDLLMPRLDGLDVLAAMQADGRSAAVLVLTSSTEDEHLVQALRAGALSYLPKTAGVDQVVASVRAAARGESVLRPAVTARMVREVRDAAADPLAQLSPRETEVLRAWPRAGPTGRSPGRSRSPTRRSRPRVKHPRQAPPRRPHPGGHLRAAAPPGAADQALGP